MNSLWDKISEWVLKEYEEEVELLHQKLAQLFDDAAKEFLKDFSASCFDPLKIAFADTILNFSLNYLKQQGVEDFLGLTTNKLREQIFIASERTIERMKGDVLEKLATLNQRGISPRQMISELREVFDDMRDYELYRIAQTELHSIENLIDYDFFLKSPDIQYVRWVATMDHRTRESHREMHNQIIRLGGLFSNGLRFPGDKLGPIEEWINCRCVIVPFYPPPGAIIPAKPFFYKDELQY